LGVGVNKKEKENRLFLLTGVEAFCWSVWLTRNKIVFYNCKPKNFVRLTPRNLLALSLDSTAAL
jgi:hypothetical protein